MTNYTTVHCNVSRANPGKVQCTCSTVVKPMAHTKT